MDTKPGIEPTTVLNKLEMVQWIRSKVAFYSQTQTNINYISAVKITLLQVSYNGGDKPLSDWKLSDIEPDKVCTEMLFAIICFILLAFICIPLFYLFGYAMTTVAMGMKRQVVLLLSNHAVD